MADTLKEKIRAIICEVAEIDEIADDAEFKQVGLDSMAALEIITAIEHEYDIKIEDTEYGRLTTLNSSYGLVAEKLAARGGKAVAG